jgi:hypothetical protein
VSARTLYALILSSDLVFFGSMVISAKPYYAGKKIDLHDAVISYLLSASDNPHGYRVASVGTSICGALLLPVAFLFYQKLSRRHRALAIAGSLIFGLGPLCALSMIFFTNDINDLHVYLATAAYFFMTLGLLICIAIEGLQEVRSGGPRGVTLLLSLLFLLAVLAFIVYLEFTPDFFNDRTLLHSVAFCEWALCAILAVCISGLALMLTRPTR